ncbi:hypothetical protein Cgig2_001548 [Carnegiea gigantea]|uniref:Endonuclease/exonuclease/phosphatase domain-containing protein n=1 Tax=Carnegiea gigantea TaxID=171969 RepID=A0A9Q1GR06_9CARY|nr:hypothetical protein Cgig2_001548 [Carnegiea gigantea]
MRSIGSYYSWTNKTIWSRIDRTLINNYWHDVFDFTQTKYATLGLSDHTPLIIQFPSSSKPQDSFKFCDIWASHKDFLPLVTASIPARSRPCSLAQMTTPDFSLQKPNNARLQPIYTLKDDNGQIVERVRTVMLSYYQQLLGPQFTPRTSLDPNIITLGPVFCPTG